MGKPYLMENFFVNTMLSTGYSLGLEQEEHSRRNACAMQLDDQTINAYLLNKLGEHERMLVNHHLEEECCEECIRRVEEASLFLGITKDEEYKSLKGDKG